MQDFNRYDFTMTLKQLEKAQEEWDGTILLIINGEYYELVDEKETDK